MFPKLSTQHLYHLVSTNCIALLPYIGVGTRLCTQCCTTANKTNPYSSVTLDNTQLPDLHYKLLGKNYTTNIDKPRPPKRLSI